MKRIIAICLALASGGMAVAEPTTLFKKGDRVVFIGNTFADQLRLYGYIETMLAARHPDYGLTFRNLGWSGDTLTLRPRPLNFGSLDDHLTEQKADVIVACFGMNESFAGEDDLQDFRRDWENVDPTPSFAALQRQRASAPGDDLAHSS
ncbi:MAG: hypothetical protein KatS3mg105_3780 [Gemmatales bacterium]|nr:MAG: hypothetical protein KatS3mg105_3780 [Gemmatales bacterium]